MNKKSFLTILLLLAAINLYAYDFSAVCSTGQTLYYNISNGAAYVTFPGSSSYNPYDGYAEPSGHLCIPNSVFYNGNTYIVSGVNSYAFYNCTGIERLIISDSVTSIDYGAFYGCSAIDSILLGSGLTYIASYAFQNCSGLKYMYYNAANYTAQLFGTNRISPFYNTNTPNFTTLVIGDSVRSIPQRAFYNRSSLKVLIISNSVTSIGNYASSNCLDIDTLSIPNSVTSLGNSVFYNCDNLLSVTTNANTIGRYAFAKCDRLVSVTLGDSVQTLGNGAFSGCFRLQNVDLGGVTAIGDSAFTGCVRLEQPELPAGLQTIGLRAFDNCNVLAGKLTFPATVTSIGDYAYNGVGTITEIEMKGAIPPTIYEHTFNSVSNSVPVSVPCGAVLSYYTTNYWENFPNIVEAPPYRLTVETNNATMGSAAVTQQPTCSNHSAIIQATAQTGYHFLQWNDGNTDNPRTINLTGDTTVTAIFAINQYTLNVVSNDNALGTVTGGGEYNYLSQVTISATAATHSHFTQWSDGNTTNPRLITLTSDTSFTAIFEADPQYQITVVANDSFFGTVSGSGTYYQGETATITATANEHYYFAQWSDGVSTNPRMVTVTGNATYTAVFEPVMYTVTVEANDYTMGQVAGSGSYAYGSTVTIEARAFGGYRFAGWSDGDTTAKRTITVIDDISLTATFAPNVGISDVVKPDYNVYVHYGHIIIKGVDKERVRIFDITGRPYSHEDHLPAGIYLVHIDGTVTKKVVVL